MQHGDRDLAVALLRKAAALGLEAILTPERYGGMELDLASVHGGRRSNWRATVPSPDGMARTPASAPCRCCCSAPKRRNRSICRSFPAAEIVAAYCLTEPHAGSDALAAKTRADLSPDGTHYILNGQKMWITNGGKADLFTVFAKVNGEQFSAFLVERAFPGVSTGARRKEDGHQGQFHHGGFLR